jgi:hypothetical protein
MNYSFHLLHHRSLPTNAAPITESGCVIEPSFENYQPPLYYILHALALKSVPNVNPLHVGRLLSLLFGIATIFIAWRILLLLNFSELQRGGALLFMSLSGVLVRFQSCVTNDSLFWLLVGLGVYAVIKISERPVSEEYWTLFAVVAIAALYTKLTSLLLLALPLALLRRDSSRAFIFRYAVFIILIVIATLPVWWRNISQFGGLFPLASGFGEPELRLPPLEFLTYSIRSFIFPWSEFWQNWLGLVLMTPLLAIIAYGLLQRLKRSPGKLAPLHLLAALSFCAFLWLNFQYHQAEGRYLFSAWPFLMLLPAAFVSSQKRAAILFVALLLPYSLFLLT